MASCRVLHYWSNNLFYNLALDHVILTLHSQNKHEATIRLWKNPKSVILGRNQSVDEEINLKYCDENDILIGRRISGGGTVYQDEGNLNLSFFMKKTHIPKNKNLLEITGFFTDLIIESLRNSGIQSLERVGSSNILYQELKISGSAGYLRGNWVLHHATLLHAVNLEHIKNALLAEPGRRATKRKSIYFPTTNLTSLNQPLWEEKLFELLEEYFGFDMESGELTDEENRLTHTFTEKMYSQPTWIMEGKRINL